MKVISQQTVVNGEKSQTDLVKPLTESSDLSSDQVKIKKRKKRKRLKSIIKLRWAIEDIPEVSSGFIAHDPENGIDLRDLMPLFDNAGVEYDQSWEGRKVGISDYEYEEEPPYITFETDFLNEPKSKKKRKRKEVTKLSEEGAKRKRLINSLKKDEVRKEFRTRKIRLSQVDSLNPCAPGMDERNYNKNGSRKGSKMENLSYLDLVTMLYNHPYGHHTGERNVRNVITQIKDTYDCDCYEQACSMVIDTCKRLQEMVRKFPRINFMGDVNFFDDAELREEWYSTRNETILKN